MVRNTAQRIVAERLLGVGGVKIGDVLTHCHLIAQPLDQIAVRIDQGKAAACGQVLARQMLKHRRFANTGLTDQIDVREPVGLANAKRNEAAMEGGHPKIGRPMADIVHTCSLR